MVAAEDVATGHEQLAVVGDPDRHARKRSADRADPHLVGGADRRGGTGLGEPVALEDGDGRGLEIPGEPRVERRASRHAEPHSSAEGRPEPGVDEEVAEPVLELERGGRPGGGGPPLAGAHGELEDGCPPAARAVLGGSEQLLEDPGHGEQIRGSERAQVVRQVVERAGEPHVQAPLEGGVHHDPREDVGEREEQKGGVAVLEDPVHPGEDLADRPHEVVVGELAALRVAGGARRVDDRREVVAAQRPDPAVDLGQIVVGGGAGQPPEPGVVEHDEVLERRVRRCGAGEQCAEIGVGDEREAGSGVGEDRPALVRAVRVVDGDRHRPRCEDGEVGDEPLHARRAHDRHPVAGRHAVGDQAAGDAADPVEEIGPGEMAPVVATWPADEHRIGSRGRPRPQGGEQVVGVGHLAGCGALGQSLGHGVTSSGDHAPSTPGDPGSLVRRLIG